MYTTYHFKSAADINMDILNAIKAAFKEKPIVITIEEEMDETAFLMADPANKAIYNRLNKLILETARTPFEGTGKPEALKHDLKGYWSRRINDEHRLVYRVEDRFVLR